MVRPPSVLITEIGHDLDEIAKGWSQKEDALIELGINDARRELEELRKTITDGDDKAYGTIKKEALANLCEICVDIWEDSPGYDQFCRILQEFRAIAKITPWDTLDSPFATNVSSIWCLPFDQYKRLRKLQIDLKNFLDNAKQGFDEKIYGPMELEQEEEAED